MLSPNTRIAAESALAEKAVKLNTNRMKSRFTGAPDAGFNSARQNRARSETRLKNRREPRGFADHSLRCQPLGASRRVPCDRRRFRRGQVDAARVARGPRHA